MTRAQELLDGRAPGRGDAAAVHALAVRLRRHAGALPGLATRVRLGQSAARRQRGLATQRLAEMLSSPVALLVRLQRLAVEAAAALQHYSGQIELLRERAGAVTTRLDALLGEIAAQRAVVIASPRARAISLAAHGWRGSQHWLVADGADDAGQAAQAAQARAALRRWHVLELEVDRAMQAWQRLQRERAALDRRIQQRLQGLPLVDEGLASSRSGALREMRAVHGWPDDVSAARRALAAVSDDPARVSALWRLLPQQARAALIAQRPEEIRHLDGIPARDRVAANRRYVELHRDELARHVDAGYLDRIISGEVQVHTFDPAADRVIEVVGDLSGEVRRMVTYVPGTGADLQGFVDGAQQQVARYLAQEVDTGTVVFVYKDGPWINWTTRSNLDPLFLGILGVQIARFQQVALLDEQLSGARQVGVGHSAGVTTQLHAERAGARYDVQVALAGAYAPDAWQPSAGTFYFSYNYLGDAILALDGHDLVTDLVTPEPLEPLRASLPTVATSEHYQHRFYPQAAGEGPVDAHNRITQGPETNSPPLKQLRHDILDSEEEH